MNVRDELLLKKIVMFCDRIADNLERCSGYENFLKDLMCQDACCMCVVQIGELVAFLSDDVKEANIGVPWKIIKDTRNFYVHKYGAIEVDSLWETLCNDIPVLKKNCEEILTNKDSCRK